MDFWLVLRSLIRPEIQSLPLRAFIRKFFAPLFLLLRSLISPKDWFISILTKRWRGKCKLSWIREWNYHGPPRKSTKEGSFDLHLFSCILRNAIFTLKNQSKGKSQGRRKRVLNSTTTYRELCQVFFRKRRSGAQEEARTTVRHRSDSGISEVQFVF